MNMYCKIKRPDNSKENINQGELVVIQEKIDGSNTAIYNDNGKIRLYSRSNELTGEWISRICQICKGKRK